MRVDAALLTWFVKVERSLATLWVVLMFRLFVGLLVACFSVSIAIESADAKKRYKKKRWSHKAKIVDIKLGVPAGTIVIVNNERRLYYVLNDRQAKRYRVAVGERIELWTGKTFVSAKRENPDWHPVDGSGKVKGGTPGNPLGKRALYLDWSLLRIHGTPSRRSIGSAVSNGCIRMYNEDVIDLFERAHIGAPVIAVNRRRDVWKFRNKEFTGKLPAWRGQKEAWKQRDLEKRLERRLGRQLARRGGQRSRSQARRSGRATDRTVRRRWRSSNQRRSSRVRY